MPTTSSLTESRKPIASAAAHVVNAFHLIRLALIDANPDDFTADERAVLDAVRSALHGALGTETERGILDLLGMQLHRGSYDKSDDDGQAHAILDGHFGAHEVWRVDSGRGSLFASPSLAEKPDTASPRGYTYWHISEDVLKAHLIQRQGLDPATPYARFPVDDR